MKASNRTKMTVHERVKAVLTGDRPDKPPFIDRLELWYRHHRKSETMPEPYRSMDLNEIHARIAMGWQKFSMPLALKLNGVELKVTHNGEPLLNDTDPIYPEFPANNAPEFVPREKAGDTEIYFSTPRGRLRLKYTITESMAAHKGAEPYLTEHWKKPIMKIHSRNLWTVFLKRSAASRSSLESVIK